MDLFPFPGLRLTFLRPSPAAWPPLAAEALVSRSNYSNHPGKGGALGSWVPLGCPPSPPSVSPSTPVPPFLGWGQPMGDETLGFGPGARELTDSPPYSSGHRPGAHGRGSSFLGSPLFLAFPPPALPPLLGFSSSSTRPAPHGSG